MMKSACDRANAGVTPPDEWRIYLSATRWRNTRPQVIDGATAAEMAIENRLFRELEDRFGPGDSVPLAIIASCSGIVEKLLLLEKIVPPDKSRKNRVADRIAAPRNSTVHAGKHPAADVAALLLQTTKELLDFYSPLARPGDAA